MTSVFKDWKHFESVMMKVLISIVSYDRQNKVKMSIALCLKWFATIKFVKSTEFDYLTQ